MKVEVRNMEDLPIRIGDIMKHKNSKLIVLVTNDLKASNAFEGVVIEGGIDYPSGAYGDTWFKENFTLFNGSITISN